MVQNIRPGIQLFFEVGESLPVVGILPGNIICVESNISDTNTFDVKMCSSFPRITGSFCHFPCIFVLFLHLYCFACLFGIFVMEFSSIKEMFSFPSMLACFCFFVVIFVSIYFSVLHLSLHVGRPFFFARPQCTVNTGERT